MLTKRFRARRHHTGVRLGADVPNRLTSGRDKQRTPSCRTPQTRDWRWIGRHARFDTDPPLPRIARRVLRIEPRKWVVAVTPFELRAQSVEGPHFKGVRTANWDSRWRLAPCAVGPVGRRGRSVITSSVTRVEVQTFLQSVRFF